MITDKILIYPDNVSENNKYLESLVKTLGEFCQVDGYNSVKLQGIKKILSYNMYCMNWYESIYSDKKLKPFVRKFFLLLILKLFGKKIIWTVHNKTAHEDSIYSKFLFFLMKEMSFKIHILCPATVQECNLQKYEKKIIYVPHGDYFNCYPQSHFDIFKYYSIASHYKILFFMGRIKPYKNIELLIESFEKSDMPKNNWKLLICGSIEINYNYYKADIQKHILNKENVIIDFNFIPDDKISSYLTQSNLLIAPYNKKSSLNSGALWLAFSYSKTMILPNIGCIRDLPNRDGFLYVYDYETAEEHLDNLVKTLNKVNSDSEFLEEKGKKAYKVMEENSWENNREKWKNLLEGLI